MKIAIVTDDLTSATDGAAGFAERGWSARVVRGTSIADRAIAHFRSWLIERFGSGAAEPAPAVQLAVSNDWGAAENHQ